MIPLHCLTDGIYGVLGLGLSGRAASLALKRAGKTVAGWDDEPATRSAAASEGIPIVDLADVNFHAVQALILSPGIPHSFPQPHPVVGIARAAGCPVIGDGELLAQACPQATYVGITGTNGKSTTTALIGHILAQAGMRCEVGGNLGTPMLALAPLGRGDVYVLEMSSYQLELTPSLVFNHAILLNISPDHLERHGGMDGYVGSKQLIFRACPPDGTAVIGCDDPHVCRIADDLARAGRRRCVRISGQRILDGGVYAEGNILVDAMDGCPKPVLDLRKAAALPGRHNAENAAAGYAAVRLLGVAPPTAAAAILSFPGLSHRQEQIATVRGVTYVNDSKATNVDAACRALASYETIYWIAGGRAKAGGLDGVERYLARVRHAFLIGEAEQSFAHALAGRVPLSCCGSLDRAVREAKALAERDGIEGAVVLLSPACASFDQFRNFEARGEAFRALVEAITA